MIIITGAGGHSLEVFDILKRFSQENIFFFDDINYDKNILRNCQILHKVKGISKSNESINYYLGVGHPKHRLTMFNKFESVNGNLHGVRGNSLISSYSSCEESDILDNCFIGPDVNISRGCLINTGAQIHHNSTISEFCEIGPRVIILGKVIIGELTSIGANSTILPGIHIGSNVIIGAGSVVTKNIPDGVKAYGIPAQIK